MVSRRNYLSFILLYNSCITAGKTTLLNVLGGRAIANLNGQVLINNVKYKKSMKRSIAYVLQEDIFYTDLTVRQQLHFTSWLRLPDSMSAQEKRAAVDEVIRTLGIERCADTRILLISGGEKKRCNIGTELLMNPSILLLDEPTSGLDSTSANALIKTLRELADDRRTLITSIHQPSSKIFYTFDKLILLADGHLVYYGAPSNCMAYLASKNYTPPGDYNPADFVMDLVNTSEAADGSKDGPSVRKLLIDAWDNASVEEEVAVVAAKSDSESKNNRGDNNSDSDEADAEPVKYLASYSTQLYILLRRSIIVSQTALFTKLTVFQTITFAIVAGLAYFQMEYDENHVIDKAGFIFLFLTYWFFMTLFQGMMQFIPERTILLKERSAGTYRLSAYFLAKTLSEMPVKLFLPFLFLAISYPMADLNPDPGAFFGIVGTQLLAALAGESVGLFIGTITMDYEKAMTMATLTSLVLMLAGGFFVQNLPSFAEWVRYVSPFKYSYDACLKMEFNRDIQCNNGEVLVECAGRGDGKVDGNEAVDFLGATESVWLNILCIIIFTLGFRIFAYLALRFLPHNSGRT